MNQRQTQQEAPGRTKAEEHQYWVQLRREGMTYSEIAALVGKNQSTVWQALAGKVEPVHTVRVRQAMRLRAQKKPWKIVAVLCGYATENAARTAVYKYRHNTLPRLEDE